MLLKKNISREINVLSIQYLHNNIPYSKYTEYIDFLGRYYEFRMWHAIGILGYGDAIYGKFIRIVNTIYQKAFIFFS